MRASELCTVAKLNVADILQLGNDPAFYGVVSIERASTAPDATWRVRLQNLIGAGVVMLVRAGRDHVLIVPRTAVKG